MSHDGKRYWFVNVGPLDEAGALEWAAALQAPEGAPATAADEVCVDLIDHRVWYARAMDVESVSDTLQVLDIGVADPSVPPDVRQSVRALVSDMRAWLEREYDADLDRQA